MAVEKEKRVVRWEEKSKGSRNWVCAYMADVGGGQEKAEHIFDIMAQKTVRENGPGLYRVTLEKDGKFWNVTGLICLKADAPKPATQSNGTPQANGNGDKYALRSQVAIAATEASGRIVAAAVHAGFFEGMSLEDITKYAVDIQPELRSSMAGFIRGEKTPEPVRQEEEEPTEAVGV